MDNWMIFIQCSHTYAPAISRTKAHTYHHDVADSQKDSDCGFLHLFFWIHQKQGKRIFDKKLEFGQILEKVCAFLAIPSWRGLVALHLTRKIHFVWRLAPSEHAINDSSTNKWLSSYEYDKLEEIVMRYYVIPSSYEKFYTLSLLLILRTQSSTTLQILHTIWKYRMIAAMMHTLSNVLTCGSYIIRATQGSFLILLLNIDHTTKKGSIQLEEIVYVKNILLINIASYIIDRAWQKQICTILSTRCMP